MPKNWYEGDITMPDLRELETYLTFQEATDKYDISAEVLTQLVKSGKTKAVRLDGTIAVAEGDVKEQAEETAMRRRVYHLMGWQSVALPLARLPRDPETKAEAAPGKGPSACQ